MQPNRFVNLMYYYYKYGASGRSEIKKKIQNNSTEQNQLNYGSD
jgi:hypothetical protein